MEENPDFDLESAKRIAAQRDKAWEEIGDEERMDRVGGDPNEIVVVRGLRYRKAPTGYTEREWFSHSTPRKGPGPGWDNHLWYLEYLRRKEGKKLNYPSELSDEPYYKLERIED